MINILKPFAVLDTALLHDKFFKATIKLTAFYVLSTAVILLISSSAVLLIFTPSETKLPSYEEGDLVEIEHDDWSLYEMREHLASVVVLVDVVLLFLVSIFAYYFARRTLLPIKNMHESQTRFMSDVAHELRTPLSIMRAGADTLLKRSRTTVEYQEFVTDVQEESARLTRLSNQLLQLLKLEETKNFEFKNLNVSEICVMQMRRLEPYAQEKQVTLSSDILPDVMLLTVSDSLVEIIQNLLKNAVDYNKKDGQVTLSLTESNTYITLSIADTGIGIAREKQADIFGRFVKADNARMQAMGSGAGLGLAIVQTLVTSLGGQITLDSQLNVGTKVTIKLPKTHS
jgi:signal transduction histidine kinase